MISERKPQNSRFAFPWALAVVLGLVLLRLPHLAGPLDDPHSWRQCDTVYYTWDFWRYGIDLLHPHVSWLGGHRTLILEFPLPEAMAALLDRAFGYTILWDRLVALGFTLLSAAWLYGIAHELADKFVARLTVIIYLIAPLAQFFSRAPQVDFAAQAFAHGLVYHALRASRRGGGGHVALAAACAALAAIIKGPYLVPMIGPLALLALGGGAAAVVTTGIPLVVGGVAFVLWRFHVNAVNGVAPEWGFLPGYYKEVNTWWWYVGFLHQRLELGNWIRLAKRFIFDIATPAGVLLAACGLTWRNDPGGRRPGAREVALAWLAGALVYMLIFFPLNVIHNYYQIPFLAPFALLAALGLRRMTSEGMAPGVRAMAWAGGAMLAILALVLPARLQYYRVDGLREAAARGIAAHVPERDLAIVVDRNSGYSDPRLLARARRCGWAVKAEDVTPALLAKLEPLGARWVAWVSEPGVERLHPPAFLGAREVARERLVGPLTTRPGCLPTVLGELYLYRLTGSNPAAVGRHDKSPADVQGKY